MLERADTEVTATKFKEMQKQAYDPRDSQIDNKKGKELYKETFAKIKLNRKVTIKQYAPGAFSRIKKLAGVKEE